MLTILNTVSRLAAAQNAPRTRKAAVHSVVCTALGCKLPCEGLSHVSKVGTADRQRQFRSVVPDEPYIIGPLSTTEWQWAIAYR